jgi:hypothetical protein
MIACFEYEQTDIPPGQTLVEWRRARVPVLNRRRWWLGVLFGGIKS